MRTPQPPATPSPTPPQPLTTLPAPRLTGHDTTATTSSITDRHTTAAPAPHTPPATLPAPATISTDEHGEQILVAADGQAYPLRVYQTLLTPNDTLPSQWWTQTTGLSAAWDYGVGSYTPLIAVIDTGYALQHEEFAGRWHQNTGEQGVALAEGPSVLNCTDRSLPLDASCNLIDDNFDGVVDNESGITTIQNPSRLNCTDRNLPLDKSCNQLDDDANGFADDVTGWDFANFDANVQAGETNPDGDGTMHGTLVTGIMAATGNNSKGIAGVNWSATILPLQALDDDSYGNTLTVARSIYYAADRGADIISISLGASAEDPYLRQAIAYAVGKGSIIVAASGNDGCNCISYPARYPEVIAVGSVAENGTPSSFSNYGAELDLLAPGEDITVPGWSTTYPTNGYVSDVAGTSLAAPYVSGLLGLAKSHQPTASWGELTAALLEQSDRRTLTAANPHSTSFGHGHVKAGTLLARVTTPAAPSLRYGFGPVTPTDTLDTSRVHQCDGVLPATFLYELKSGNTLRYTASKLTRHQAQQTGWTQTRALPTCIGLPHDQPETVRTINLLSEIHNNSLQKWQP